MINVTKIALHVTVSIESVEIWDWCAKYNSNSVTSLSILRFVPKFSYGRVGTCALISEVQGTWAFAGIYIESR